MTDIADDTDPADLYSLVERARRTLADAYVPSNHRTACALRTGPGDVQTGIHLDAALGNASVHAEAAALASACEAGGGDVVVDAIVAVSYVPENRDASVAREDVLDAAVVPPCGTCRELLYEYGPDATVVVQADPTLRTTTVDALLPDAPWYTEW
jgi:cytidine deaminase